MPKLYNKPDDAARALLAQAMAHHDDLAAAGVRVGVVMVDPARSETGEPTGPALGSHHTWADVRLVGRRQRVYTPLDMLIDVDAVRWHELDDPKRVALLDHELTHVEVARGDEGQVIMDVDGRPKLRMIEDDYLLSGFYAVAERHGADAMEVVGARGLWDKGRQLLFPWAQGAQSKRKVRIPVAGGGEGRIS